MKSIIVHDVSNKVIFHDNSNVYCLNKLDQKDCCGCFSCWLSTPGECIYNDSIALLKDYLLSDKVVIISKLKYGFISGMMKTFLDRLLPLYLPHSHPEANGYNHLPRYSKYPDIDFYYLADFKLEQEEQTLESYITRTFKQFRCKNILIKKIKSISEVKINENTYN